MPYTIGICDDCAEQVELLVGFLRDCGEYGEFHVIHASKPEAFLEKTATDRPDLVFLDVDMDGMNGIELGEKIRETHDSAVLVYITGYEQYAYEAFQLRAFHYLLKPITAERFRQVLDEALAYIQQMNTGKPEQSFPIQNRNEILNLPYRDILYFEKTGHQIKIHALSHEFCFYGNFKNLLAKLDGNAFVQCHQGYIANVDKIRAYRDKTLFMDGNVRLPVSRSFSEQVRQAIEKQLFAGREPL